jgi:hypothetical protein
MKPMDIKFAASQMLLLAGLVALSIGFRWTFFIGLALVVSSTLLVDGQPKNLAGRILQIAACVGMLAFMMWCLSLGAKPLPWSTGLVIWPACFLSEFFRWRKNRQLA